MFSKATEYAIRATIFIAQKSSEENKLGIAEISRAIDSPRSFTAKIMQLLTKDNKLSVQFVGHTEDFSFLPKQKNYRYAPYLWQWAKIQYWKNA